MHPNALTLTAMNPSRSPQVVRASRLGPVAGGLIAWWCLSVSVGAQAQATPATVSLSCQVQGQTMTKFAQFTPHPPATVEVQVEHRDGTLRVQVQGLEAYAFTGNSAVKDLPPGYELPGSATHIVKANFHIGESQNNYNYLAIDVAGKLDAAKVESFSAVRYTGTCQRR